MSSETSDIVSSEENVENPSGSSDESLKSKDEVYVVPTDEGKAHESEIPSGKCTEIELSVSKELSEPSEEVGTADTEISNISNDERKIIETSIGRNNECTLLEEPPSQSNENKTHESSHSPTQSDERKENKNVLLTGQNYEIKAPENVVPIEHSNENKVLEGVFVKPSDKSKVSISVVPAEQGDESKAAESVVPAEQGDDSKEPESVVPAEQGDDSKELESVVPVEQGDESKAPENVVPPEHGNESKVTKNAVPPEPSDESKVTENVVSAEQEDESKALGSVAPSEQGDENKVSKSVVFSKASDKIEASEGMVSPEKSDKHKAPEAGISSEKSNESKPSKSLEKNEKSETLGKLISTAKAEVIKESEDGISPKQSYEIRAPGNVVYPQQSNENKALGSVESTEQNNISKASGRMVSSEQSNDRKAPEVMSSSKQSGRREACEAKQVSELEASEGPSQKDCIETCEYPERKIIEYGHITWTVENLSLSDTRAYCVKSSNFRIDVSSESLWYLGLEWHPESDLNRRKYKKEMREKAKRERAKKKDPRRELSVTPFNDPRFVMLNLVKLPNKINPEESVRVSFRIGYEYKGNIYWIESVHTYFGRNHRRHKPIEISINDYQETHTFLCDLVIYNSTNKLRETPSYEMSALTQVQFYLRDLWISHKFSDITIRAGNQEILAHKYILHARSAFFKKMIEEEDYSNTLDLNTESYETLCQLLYYVYTGDIALLAEKGKLPFYFLECAERLEIQGLDELIKINKISLLTFTPAVSIKYDWIIKNYNSYEDGKIKVSPELESCSTEALSNDTVKYRIKFVKNRRIVGLFVEARTNQEADVLAEVAVINDKGEEVYSRFYGFTSPEVYFGGDTDHALAESNDYYIQKIVNNDSISVVIRLTVSQCKYTSRVETFATSGVTDLSGGSLLNKLSEDMSTVLKEGLGSDLIIRTKDKEFKVHKAILQTNSIAFMRLAEPIGKGQVLECLDIPGNVMESVIKFLYTGRLEETDVDVLYRIYEATAMYDAGYLRSVCLERLKSTFSVETICEILYKYYTISESPELLDAATHFICCNAATILLSNEWKDLKSKSSTLRDKVLYRLTKAFRDKNRL